MSVLTNIKAASAQLGVSKSTLYGLAQRGEIPHHRIGDRVLVDVEEIRKVTRFEPGLPVSDRMTGTIANEYAASSTPVSARCPQKRRAK